LRVIQNKKTNYGVSLERGEKKLLFKLLQEDKNEVLKSYLKGEMNSSEEFT